MGIVIKQSIRSSILAYIGVVVGAFNLLFLYPTFLTPEQIGLLKVIPSAAFLMATFAQIGLAQSVIKFLPFYPPGSQGRKEYLGFTILAAALGYGALLVLTFVLKKPILNYFSKESSLFVEYFQVSLVVTLFLLYIQISEAYSRSLLKSIAPIYIRDVQLRLLTTSAVLLFGYGVLGFDSFVRLFMVLYGLTLMSHIIYFVSIKSHRIKFSFQQLKAPDIKRILRYGGFTLIGASGTQIVLQIDSIMVAGIVGLNATGIYAIAVYIGTIIEIPRRSITQITTPLISQAFKKGAMKEVTQYYRQTSINQLIIGGLILIGVWANLDSIYALIPNSEIYKAGFNVVLLFGLAKVIDMLFGVNGEIIVMSKYYKFNVITVAALALATIVGNSLLIPIYGIDGAALGSLLAMLLFNLIKLIFVFAKFRIQPFGVQTLKFLGVAGVVIVMNLVLPKLSNIYTDILLRSSLITIVLVSLTYSLQISPEVNGIIKRLLARFSKTR